MKPSATLLLAIATTTPSWSAVLPEEPYCIDHGGVLESRDMPGGSNYYVCQFKDGTECESAEYYAGTCGPGQTKRFVSKADARPDLAFFIGSSGYTKSKDSVQFVEEWEANYYYNEVKVENINPWSGTAPPSKVVIHGDPNTEVSIPQLNKSDKSQWIHIYTPIQYKGVFAEINPDRKVDEKSYDNNQLKEWYWREGIQLMPWELEAYRKNKGLLPMMEQRRQQR